MPVAFSGRVPVLVTNENGRVMQGDHLTVSETLEGYAMKAVGTDYSLGRAISDAPDAATASVLMVVENKYNVMKITSIAGLTAIASTPDSFVHATTTVYQTIIDKLVYGTSVANEYLSVQVKAIAGYFDKLFAREIYTDKVCIKKNDGQDVCLTGDQLDSMLHPVSGQSSSQSSNTGLHTISLPSNTSTSATTSEVTSSATTTDISTSSTTEMVKPNETPASASSTPEVMTTNGTSTQSDTPPPTETSTTTTVSLITDTPTTQPTDVPVTQ